MTPIAILATLALALAASIPANTVGPVPGSGQGPLPGTTVPSRKVLIIGIDGLRSDAFRKADTPHLNGLKKSGALAERAVTDVCARSGPGWTSILTGVWSWKHGARDNAFQGYRPDLHPTFLDRLRLPGDTRAGGMEMGRQAPGLRSRPCVRSPGGDPNRKATAMKQDNNDPWLPFGSMAADRPIRALHLERGLA